jgi:hypothetical protein
MIEDSHESRSSPLSVSLRAARTDILESRSTAMACKHQNKRLHSKAKEFDTLDFYVLNRDDASLSSAHSDLSGFDLIDRLLRSGAEVIRLRRTGRKN